MPIHSGKRSVLLEKSFAFSVRIIRLYQYLCKQKEFSLASQILRSGTSIGANIEEANGGISVADFSSKISIAYKEARETRYWLFLLKETEYIEEKLFKSLETDCEELLKILYASLKKTRINKS